MMRCLSHRTGGRPAEQRLIQHGKEDLLAKVMAWQSRTQVHLWSHRGAACDAVHHEPQQLLEHILAESDISLSFDRGVHTNGVAERICLDRRLRGSKVTSCSASRRLGDSIALT
jgi:uncharacterized protein YeaC (DUF1315 family)